MLSRPLFRASLACLANLDAPLHEAIDLREWRVRVASFLVSYYQNRHVRPNVDPALLLSSAKMLLTKSLKC